VGRGEPVSKKGWAILLLILLTLISLALVGKGQGAPVHPSGPIGSPNGAPSFDSAFIVDGGRALILVGYPSWGNQYTSAASGSQVYAGSLWLIGYDLTEVPLNVSIDLFQAGYGWVNNSYLFQPREQTDIGVTLAYSVSWTATELRMGGDTTWTGTVAVPISLLPPSVANLGGLDLLVLAVISEMVIVASSAVAVARWMMRRANWAPKFSLLVWGHVVLIGIASAVLLDFQYVDATFAGWSPLVYAFAIWPMLWAFALSYFNHSFKVEGLQPLARTKVRFGRMLLQMAVLPDGRTELVLETWAGFWHRFWGHHVIVEGNEPNRPDLARFPIDHIPSPTKTRARRRERRRAEGWEVVNPQGDGTTEIVLLDSSEPPVVRWPKLSVHRIVDVPPKLSPEGAVLVPAHPKRKLALPHYIEGAAEGFRIAPVHDIWPWAVASRWANVSTLARIHGKTETELQALKAQYHADVNAEVESRLVSWYSLMGQPTRELTEEEARQEAERKASVRSLSDLLGEPSLREQPKQVPTGKGSGA
jgi:hypothetical protein